MISRSSNQCFVITRNWEAKPHEYDWSIFFLVGQLFFLKKLQRKIYFCFLDCRSRWPGLLWCCIHGLCVCLHIFCSPVCFLFFMLFFQWRVFLSGAFPCFFACEIAELVLHFFCYFISAFIDMLWYPPCAFSCLFACLFLCVLLLHMHLRACRYFLQWFYALLNCFFKVNCTYLHFLLLCG